MRVAEMMTIGVETTSADTSAAAAWELMRRKGIHHLVVMADAVVIGVLSDRDAGGRNGAAIRTDARVRDLMTTSVVAVDRNTTVRRAANLMRGRTIGCLPVVERGRLVGILTVSDLLELLGRGVDRPASPTRRVLHHRAPHRKQRGSSRAW